LFYLTHTPWYDKRFPTKLFTIADVNCWFIENFFFFKIIQILASLFSMATTAAFDQSIPVFAQLIPISQDYSYAIS